MVLQIVGGTYIEKCLFPEWNEVFGSGLRAALAAKALGADVAFHTYAGSDSLPTLASRAEIAGVCLYPVETDLAVGFEYVHGLSTPLITPAPGLIRHERPLEAKGDAVLRFGFMEGDAVVNGGRVVYDPQNPYLPETYHKNGSRADHLAMVCNRAEAWLLTNEREPQKAAETLRAKEACEVVVVKCGSHGCVVCEADGIAHIPAFKTDFVWPIGSGDVFAGTFAKVWAADGASAVDAARLASRAVAFYCSTMTLDFADPRFAAFDPKPFIPADERKPASVYLAGPFFSMSQNWLIEEAFRALEGQQLRVFSPLHHVGRGRADEVYDKDIGGLEKADLVFACVDGLDSGTIFEIGYAAARGKRVIAFVQNERPEDLKMLEGAGCLLERDFVTAIYRTYWLARG